MRSNAESSDEFFRIPRSLGGYQIDPTPLGQGAFGLLLRAQHTRLEWSFAVKLFHPTDRMHEGESFLHRFEQEAKLGAQLDHHVFVPVFDYAIEPQSRRPYFVMRLGTDVKSLDDLITNRDLGPASRKEPELRDLCHDLAPLAEGLDFLHHSQIWHQDITPQNILVSIDPQYPSRYKRVYLIDLGCAAHCPKDTNRLYTTAPTTYHYFWPPWQIDPPKSADECRDIDLYQFGMLLTTVIYGHAKVQELAPYPGSQESRRFGPSDLFHKTKLPRLGLPELQVVLSSLTARDPQKRYRSAQELYQDLSSLGRGQLPLSKMARRSVTLLRETVVWQRKAPKSFWTLILLCIVIVFSAGFAITSHAEKLSAQKQRDAEKRQRLQQDAANLLFAAQEGLDEGRTDLSAAVLHKLITEVQSKYSSLAVDFARRWIEQETATGLIELKGHQEAVRRLVVSDDGRLLVSGDRQQRLMVWDVARRLPQYSCTLSQYGAPCDLSLSADSRRLAVRTETGHVLAMDLTLADPLASAWTLAKLTPDTTPEQRPDWGGTSVAITPQGDRVAWNDQSGRLWTAEISDQFPELRGLRQIPWIPTERSTILGGLCFSGSGRQLALTTVQSIVVFDMEGDSSQQIARRVAQFGNSRPCRCGRDGDQFLVTDHMGESISIFEFEDLDRRVDIPVGPHAGYIGQTSAVCGSQTNRIAVASRQNNLVVIDLQGSTQWRSPNLTLFPSDVALSASGEWLAWTAGTSIHLSQVSAKLPALRPVVEFTPAGSNELLDARPVMDLDPSGRWLASCLDGRTLHITPIPQQTARWPRDPLKEPPAAINLATQEDVIFACRFTDPHELLVARRELVSDREGRVKLARIVPNAAGIWTAREVGTWNYPRRHFGRSGYLPLQGTFSSDGQWLAIGNLQSMSVVQLLPVSRPSEAEFIRTEPDVDETRSIPVALAPTVCSLTLDGSGSALWWVDSELGAFFYDCRRKTVQRLEVNHQEYSTVRISPHNQYFAATGPRGVEIWSMNDQKSWTTLGDHPILGFDFLGDAVGLVGGDADGNLIVWDLASNRKLLQRPLRSSAIVAMKANPSADWLATLHLDGRVCVWDVRLAQMIDFRNWNGRDAP